MLTPLPLKNSPFDSEDRPAQGCAGRSHEQFRLMSQKENFSREGTLRSIWKNPIHFIACGFGAGAMPFAPGTFGTLIAIPLYLILQPLPLALYISIVVIAGLVGIWLCHVTARDMGVHDHPAIVWDEIVGYWLTMIAAPAGWIWIWLGFLLFRLFDIWKPWPIRWVDQRIQGGFGIMFDDILAGLYAWICLHSIHFLFYRIF